MARRQKQQKKRVHSTDEIGAAAAKKCRIAIDVACKGLSDTDRHQVLTLVAASCLGAAAAHVLKTAGKPQDPVFMSAALDAVSRGICKSYREAAGERMQAAAVKLTAEFAGPNFKPDPALAEAMAKMDRDSQRTILEDWGFE